MSISMYQNTLHLGFMNSVIRRYSKDIGKDTHAVSVKRSSDQSVAAKSSVAKDEEGFASMTEAIRNNIETAQVSYAGESRQLTTDGTKRSGHIAETLQAHPDWRTDVERQICAGEKLKEMYPPSKPVEEMSLDEYKTYIWDVIGKIPLDSSHFKDDMTINISEEGFLTMKDDPEYESWLLGHNYVNLTFHNPWASFPQWSGTYGVDNFGASIEEHHGGSWSKSVPGAEKKYHEERGEGFWERRTKRAKRYLKEQEKKALAKREYQRLSRQLPVQWW